MKERLKTIKENLVIFFGAWLITGVFLVEKAKAFGDKEDLRFGAIFLALALIGTVFAIILAGAGYLAYKAVIWLKKGH